MTITSYMELCYIFVLWGLIQLDADLMEAGMIELARGEGLPSPPPPPWEKPLSCSYSYSLVFQSYLPLHFITTRFGGVCYIFEMSKSLSLG